MKIDWRDVLWRQETLSLTEATILLLGENPEKFSNEGAYLGTKFKGEVLDGFYIVRSELVRAIENGELPNDHVYYDVYEEGTEFECRELNPRVTAVSTAELKSWVTRTYIETEISKCAPEDLENLVARLKSEGKQKEEIAAALYDSGAKDFHIGKLLSDHPPGHHEPKDTTRKRGERLRKKKK